MQTFLPYPSFIGSAKVLDVRRLGKQRVENLQIMQALLSHRVTNTHKLEPTGEIRLACFDRDGNEIPIPEVDPFDFHKQEMVPVMHVVRTPQSEWRVEPYNAGAWASHPAVLMWAGYEDMLMGYQDAICEEWTDRTYKDTCRDKTRFLYNQIRPACSGNLPDWIGDEEFHRSHQSNLVRKHPEYYRQFFPDVPDDLPYLWPVTVASREKQAL